MAFTWLGFKDHVTKHYGAKCDVCENTFAAQVKCLYNGATKQFRCLDCHFNHPANLCELWLVDKTEQDEDTGEYVTRRTVIITDSRQIETAQNQFRHSGIQLIERLESFTKGTRQPIEVRRQYMEQLKQGA